MNINTYAKFAPNVFVAKCYEAHAKGDIVTLTSKYGKEAKVKLHNLVKQQEGYYFYSFTRCDGTDSQTRAKDKADKYQRAAENALKRSDNYVLAASEGKDFLSLGEPIKIGHHSEKRHRALLARNAKRMEKSQQERQRAESYEGKIEYWTEMAEKIDLSMPESLAYFAFELTKAKEQHQLLKENPALRTHNYSLTYAKKAVNELEKKVKLAQLLWA